MATNYEDEVQIVNGTNPQTTDKYLRWPKEMDQLLLDLLKEEKAKGNKDEKQFNKAACTNVIAVLNFGFQKYGKTINKTKSVNRLKTIQKQMGLAIEVLDKKSGFGWNDITKKIEAAPSVWDTIIKMKPDYDSIRDKELHFLEDARELFEKDRANGDGAMSAKEKFYEYHNAESELGIDDIDRMQANNEIHIDSFQPDSIQIPRVAMPQVNIDVNARNARPGGKESTKGTKRKRSISSAIAEEIMQVTSSMKEIAHAIQTSNQRIYTATEISTELKTLGLDKWDVVEAVDFLKDNEQLVERFFACDDEIKLPWLRKKMGYNDDD